VLELTRKIARDVLGLVLSAGETQTSSEFIRAGTGSNLVLLFQS
jgi:hypothetical protein